MNHDGDDEAMKKNNKLTITMPYFYATLFKLWPFSTFGISFAFRKFFGYAFVFCIICDRWIPELRAIEIQIFALFTFDNDDDDDDDENDKDDNECSGLIWSFD